MHRREAIGLLGLAAGVTAEPPARERFVGVWRLVSYENRPANGEITRPFGTGPVGRIAYDKAGRMSAQIMRPGRKAPETVREAQSGFIAYFGTYEVDEASRTVTHHVEAALNPSWPGTDLRRGYEFSENRLTLTVKGANGVLALIWQLEPD